MAISEPEAERIKAYAQAIANAWPPISDEKRERLAHLFSGPWLYDDYYPPPDHPHATVEDCVRWYEARKSARAEVVRWSGARKGQA